MGRDVVAAAVAGQEAGSPQLRPCSRAFCELTRVGSRCVATHVPELTPPLDQEGACLDVRMMERGRGVFMGPEAHSETHCFDNCLLNTYCIPGAVVVLGTWG